MTKAEMIEKIKERVASVYATIERVYGVSNGVGYDMNVYVNFKDGKEWELEAHAGPRSWDSHGHLRPNNPYYKYTGSNDVYQSQCVNWFEIGPGLKFYLERYKKVELEKLYNEVC